MSHADLEKIVLDKCVFLSILVDMITQHVTEMRLENMIEEYWLKMDSNNWYTDNPFNFAYGGFCYCPSCPIYSDPL